MALFKPARTFDNPAQSQSGFAAPGAGAQVTGDPTYVSTNDQPSVWEARRPTKGRRTFLGSATPRGEQQGFPAPQGTGQARPSGSMPNDPPIFGGVYQNYTPYYDRGAAAFVPNFGYVLTNPIGAGVVAMHRPQASYGGAAQYFDSALWWTNQIIPTSINLQGLTDPQELEAILGSLNVQAVVRTTG